MKIPAIIIMLAVSLVLLPSCSQLNDLLEIPETLSDSADGQTLSNESNESNNSNDEIIKQLFDEQKSDVQVTGTGTVTKILSDDNDGSRHQRFILELASGQTLLVAHNVDVAPRLDGLSVGDTVEFKGEYYYNAEGGGIHWTHIDPDGVHADGYLKWNGKIYQ